MSKMIQHNEWVEITGYERGSKQCEHLDNQGIRYTKKAGSIPVLSWEAYNRQMSQPAQATKDSRSAPNLEVLAGGR